MANVNILGALGVQDSDYVKLRTYGQGVIYDALGQILGDHNADLAAVEALFIEGETSDHTTNYKLPGTGRLQVMGPRSRAAEVKASGSWDVAFPLEQYGAALAIDRINWAYMDARTFNHHVQTVFNQDVNTRRFNILKALFNNTARTFVDPNWGSLTVQPLAIGSTDGVLYPPVVGAEVNSTRQNYLGTATDISAAGAIVDATNPIPTIVNALEQSFGTPTGGSDIVIFCNNAQTSGLQSLAGFDTVPNRFVTYGDNVSLVESAGLPINVGRVLGESDSALLVEWRWIPAGYLLALHFGAPRPLMKRVDPPDTGLTTGLQMVPSDMDQPFIDYEWSNRYGFGCGNRLNGIVMDLTAAGGASTYTIPTAYA
jgi:hypothetical protein